MSLPMMPFWVPDYIADTTHLTLEEHGAYLLLICHYWQNEGLPNDEVRLARIVGAMPEQWSSIAPAMRQLFGTNWTHGRIDRELALAKEKHEKRVNAGISGAKARRNGHNGKQYSSNASSNAPAMRKQSQSQSQSHKEIDRGADFFFDFAEAINVDPEDPSLFGFHHQLCAALERGFKRETILAAAANAMRGKAKPPPWAYFAKCIESENEQRSSPAKQELNGAKHGTTENSGLAAIDRIFAQASSGPPAIAGPNENVVLSLPARPVPRS